MKGKLIIIESGTDGSGKATQAQLLYDRLKQDNDRVKKITFPNYDSDASSLVKMYLKGSFGDNPMDVNPYAASTFYTVDRFASFKMDWQSFYDDGGIIISDRYTTSNMVHQASKINDMKEKNEYLDWLWDFEFYKFNLPIPDCVLFLDMPPIYTQKLMENRANKFTGEAEKDIHEKDQSYLIDSYNNALYVAEKYKWMKISCIDQDKIRDVHDISDEIYKKIKAMIESK